MKKGLFWVLIISLFVLSVTAFSAKKQDLFLCQLFRFLSHCTVRLCG